MTGRPHRVVDEVGDVAVHGGVHGVQVYLVVQVQVEQGGHADLICPNSGTEPSEASAGLRARNFSVERNMLRLRKLKSLVFEDIYHTRV